jgi:hypothetical protein
MHDWMKCKKRQSDLRCTARELKRYGVDQLLGCGESHESVTRMFAKGLPGFLLIETNDVSIRGNSFEISENPRPNFVEPTILIEGQDS